MEEPALRASSSPTFEELGPVQRVAICSGIVLSATGMLRESASALTIEADVGTEEILVHDGDGGARGGEDAQEHVRTHHLVMHPRHVRGPAGVPLTPVNSGGPSIPSFAAELNGAPFWLAGCGRAQKFEGGFALTWS